MLKMLGKMAYRAGVLSLAVSCFSAISAAQAQKMPVSRSVQQSSSSSHAYPKSKANVKGKKAKAKKEVVETPPPPPPPPPTPEQMPAQTPQVSYAGGLLTINAPNSTMNDVLAAVRRVTGATIEKPPMSGSDRVVAHLGPGQPKDVLAALLNGSRYDYIILGATGQPGAVQRIILTARSSTPAQSPVASNVPGRPAPNQQPAVQQEEPDNSTDTEDMTVPEQNAPEQEQPPQEQPQEQPQQQPQQPSPAPGYPQPASPEQQPQTQPPQGQEDQGQQPRVKSPEELLRELQQMQQQQQNQQNQQNQQQPPQ